MKEQEFNCPYCYSQVSTWVETSKLKQQFVEDCVECKNPLGVIVDCAFGVIQNIMINPISQ